MPSCPQCVLNPKINKIYVDNSWEAYLWTSMVILDQNLGEGTQEWHPYFCVLYLVAILWIICVQIHLCCLCPPVYIEDTVLAEYSLVQSCCGEMSLAAATGVHSSS
jgi:hypothetical protein